MSSDDLRAEFADIVRSVRTYLEVQQDTGASGIPRGKQEPPLSSALDGPRSRASTSQVMTQPAPSIVSTVPVVPTPKDALPKATRSLAVLEQEVASCKKCVLHETRTKTVFFRGNPEARLCFVGEAPGEDEDKQGKPFVGRAGQLLDKMIVAMGLVPEKDVYVCNILKCRPPGNRRPTPEETELCIPYLHEQLANVRPQVMVALGNTAVSALLGTKLGITKIRGEWKLYKGTTLVMPTYHPSYLLRPTATQAQSKREAWEDLQKVLKQLGLPIPTRNPR